MRITIESTDDLGYIELETGAEVPCRIWKGTTAAGTACLLFVTRIAVAEASATEFADVIDCTESTTVKLLDELQ